MKHIFALLAQALIAASVLLAPAAFAHDIAIPEDLAQFVSEFDAAIRSHDLDKVMSFYSERYRQDGRDKAMHRAFLDSWLNDATAFETNITHYRRDAEDHAYIGATIRYKVVTEGEKTKRPDYQVVKENGRWRWLGYQE